MAAAQAAGFLQEPKRELQARPLHPARGAAHAARGEVSLRRVSRVRTWLRDRGVTAINPAVHKPRAYASKICPNLLFDGMFRQCAWG